MPVGVEGGSDNKKEIFVKNWRIKNSKNEKVYFQASSFTQQRLAYIFISDCLKFSVKNTFIMIAISTNHSLVFLSVSKEQNGFKDQLFLVNNQAYVENMKKLIETFITNYISNTNPQTKWEFFKLETRKYTIKYTKGLGKMEKATLFA